MYLYKLTVQVPFKSSVLALVQSTSKHDSYFIYKVVPVPGTVPVLIPRQRV